MGQAQAASKEEPSLSPSSTANQPYGLGQMIELFCASIFLSFLLNGGIIMTHFTKCLLQG